MHVFLFSPLNVNAKTKLYSSNQQKQILSSLGNDEFNNNFSFRKNEEWNYNFPTGNGEFNENFLYERNVYNEKIKYLFYLLMIKKNT